jgi:hypothetical protein
MRLRRAIASTAMAIRVCCCHKGAMNRPAKITSTPEIDSDAAIALAAVEGDFSFLSTEMRLRVEDGFRRMTEKALASGSIPADWEAIKRRGRNKLRQRSA